MKEKDFFRSLVGQSDCFLRAVGRIPTVARSNTVVLLSGESGTGKELFARAIHYESFRQNKPFIPVNCGAVPDHLFENELFGHIRGAFTDAAFEQKGLVAEAEGGTLFLDEIDALNLSGQVKLLRFLQDGEYRPLGSPKNRFADVRTIAATNTDLKLRVETKLFREDLYYRLNIVSLYLPPLRERLGDIPILAAHFLSRYGCQYDRGSLCLSSGAIQKLLAYSWPGNIRELEAVLHQAVLLAPSLTIQPHDIAISSPCLNAESAEASLRGAKNRIIEEFERGYLISLLARHEGNISRASKAAGKDRRSFQRLLRKYGLQLPPSRNVVRSG